METNRCPPFESRQLVLSIYFLIIFFLSLLYKSAKMKVKFFGEGQRLGSAWTPWPAKKWKGSSTTLSNWMRLCWEN